MPGENALVLHMHELLQYLNRQGATTFLTVAQHGLVGDMKAPVDVTYLADTVILLRYFEALRPGPPRHLGRQEADQRARGHDPRISARQHGHGPRRAAGRVPGRAARRADPGRRGAADDRRRVPLIPDISEKALILAPTGRDAPVAAAMLEETGIRSETCTDLPSLVACLEKGAGFALVTEEALRGADVRPLSQWINAQPEWSDFPFVLLTLRGGGLEQNPSAGRYLDLLGNVTFVERPFHPTTLVSLARSALRGRRRQYEARARLMELQGERRALPADRRRRRGVRDRLGGRGRGRHQLEQRARSGSRSSRAEEAIGRYGEFFFTPEDRRGGNAAAGDRAGAGGRARDQRALARAQGRHAASGGRG